MTREAFYQLVEKHLNGLTSDHEQQQLINFTQSFQREGWDSKLLGDAAFLQHELYKKILDSLTDNEDTAAPASGVRTLVPSRTIGVRRWVAAAVLILASLGAYFWSTWRPDKQQPIHAKLPTPAGGDILPGGNKAVLTLGDGTTVILDGAADGQIAQQHGVSIVKKDGQVIYGPAEAADITAAALNTMSTPRGGQYQLTLPDGSRVWLNAASSITYPTVFLPGISREVEVTGEVYFEVVRDAARPFLVNAVSPSTRRNMGRVEVLGTSFNINAYEDEPAVRTDLLEGSIKFGSEILRQGQAYFRGKVHDVDVQRAVAWKNGLFYFDDADLSSVLRQISRWYNVDIEYPNGVPDRVFGGKIERSLTLSQMLLILERMEIRFRITEDRRLIVLPWREGRGEK